LENERVADMIERAMKFWVTNISLLSALAYLNKAQRT